MIRSALHWHLDPFQKAHNQMNKKRVLIIYRSYFPSTSHLGPATAIRNLVNNMSTEYQFHILTLNFEFATGAPLFNDAVHVEEMDNVCVEYIPRGLAGLRILLKRLKENYDVVDIQCAFDPLLAIPALILCRLGFSRRSRVFHTPHGIFMDVIMSASWLRKRAFCLLSDAVGLYRNVTHLAGSPGEETDIRRNHLRKQDIQVVSQFVESIPANPARRTKLSNQLRIAFVGRVTVQKNLIFAIRILRDLNIPWTMSVFGDISDQAYYATCKKMIQDELGESQITFLGGIEKGLLFAQLTEYDILLHPTLGENFGHSIVEALSLGVPVLIRDRAPWTNVETFNAGWSLPLTQPQMFVDRLQGIYAMGAEWSSLSDGALRYARGTFDRTKTTSRYRAAYG